VVSPPFRHRIRVRYSECDLQGVVFNANYLTYLDDAITELFRAALNGGYGQMVEAGVDMVVAESTLRYLAPARFDDEVEVQATVTRLGTTGMTTAMRVLRGGETLTEAELRHVFVRAREGGKAPIPDAVREALEPWSISG
jgi:acyl-CoA thioester hydrolase